MSDNIKDFLPTGQSGQLAPEDGNPQTRPLTWRYQLQSPLTDPRQKPNTFPHPDRLRLQITCPPRSTTTRTFEKVAMQNMNDRRS